MSTSFSVDPAALCDHLAWAMLHFLWQGTVIAAVLFIASLALRRADARIRYGINAVGLLLLAACIPITALLLNESQPPETDRPINLTAAPPNLPPPQIHDATATTEVPLAEPDTTIEFADADLILSDSVEAPMIADEAVAEELLVGFSEQAAEPSSETYGRYVVGSWLIGVVLMLLRMCRGIWKGWQLQRNSRDVTDSVLVSIATTQAERLGMKVVPALRYCERIAVPMVIGLLKPVVLLPPGLLTGLEPDQLRAILCHEFAHIRRMDQWVHLFQHLMESVLFFHPAVWWISHRISVEREVCCDDLVVSVGCERLQYAGALIKAAEIFSEDRGRGLLPQVTALRASGGSGSQFNRRVRRLLGDTEQGATGSRSVVVICVLLLMLTATAILLQRNEANAGDEEDDAGVTTAADDSAEGTGIKVPLQPNNDKLTGFSQWGGSSRRNHVANVSLPLYFDLKSGENVKWKARLGNTVYNTPVVADGKVFIGTNNAGYNEKYPQHTVDLGCLVCFDQRTGELIWQYSVPAVAQPKGNFNHQFMPMQGITSAPIVEQGRSEWRNGRTQKNRLWLMNNRAEVVCLDVEGFKDGNAGPVTDESDTGAQDADVIWRFDLRKELGVTPAWVSCSSPTVAGDLLLINSSHSPYPMRTLAPEPKQNKVPAFLAFNKNTGGLLWSANSPGNNILDIAWSSPAFDVIDGVPQAIFAGGDGWLYSFDARDIAIGSTNLLWKFDCNEKDAEWTPGGGKGRRNSIVATPVIHDGLVYIATGLNPENGEGPGAVICIDPTKRGDVSHELVFSKNDPETPLPPRRGCAIEKDSDEYAAPNPNSAQVWRFTGEDLNGDGKIKYDEQMHRTTSCVTVTDGFAVVSDASGFVHCLDARSGRCFWTHDLLAPSNGTPLISRDRIYVGDEDGEVTILALNKQKSVIAEIETENSIYGSLVAGFFNGNRLLIPCRNELLCVKAETSIFGSKWEPREWQYSTREGSLLAWQSVERGLHFAIHHDGFMATGVGSGGGVTYWEFDGHVALGTNHRVKIKVLHNCESPNFVTLGGKRFDLENGRLFGVDLDGDIVQAKWTRTFGGENRGEQVRKAGEQISEVKQKQAVEAGSNSQSNVDAESNGEPIASTVTKKNNVAAASNAEAPALTQKSAVGNLADKPTASETPDESDIDAIVARQSEQLIHQLAERGTDADTMQNNLAKMEYRLRLGNAIETLQKAEDIDRIKAMSEYVATLLHLEKKFRGTSDGFNALWNVFRRADSNRMYGTPHAVPLNDLLTAVKLLQKHYIKRAELHTCFPYLIHNCPFEESESLLLEAREDNEFDYNEAAACFHSAEFLQWKSTIPTQLSQWQKLRGGFSSEKAKWADQYIAASKALDDGKSDRARRSAVTAAEFVSGEAGKPRMPTSVPDIDYTNATAMIFQSGLSHFHRKRRFPAYSERAKALLFDLRRLTIGYKAPDIVGDDVDGKPMKLSDFEGKVILLIFSGNWDGSYRGLNTAAKKLQEEFDETFAVVSVRNDKSIRELKKDYETEGISWPCWHDGFDGPISRQWNIREWPATFLIDHNGIIRHRDVPHQLLHAAATQLISRIPGGQANANDRAANQQKNDTPKAAAMNEQERPIQFRYSDAVCKVRLTELHSSEKYTKFGLTTTMAGEVISSITGDLKPGATLKMTMQSGGRIMPDFVSQQDLKKGATVLVVLKGTQERYQVMHVLPAVAPDVARTYGESEADILLTEMAAIWTSYLPQVEADGVTEYPVDETGQRVTAIKQLGYLRDPRGAGIARAAAASKDDDLARQGAIALYRMKLAPDAKRAMEVFDKEMMSVWYEESGKPQKTKDGERIYKQQGNKRIMQRGVPDFDYATYVREGIKRDFATKDEASLYLFFGVPWKVQRPECVPELMKLIDHDNPRVRRFVVSSLNHTVNDVDGPTWEQFQRDEGTFINRWKTWWKDEGKAWMSGADSI